MEWTTEMVEWTTGMVEWEFLNQFLYPNKYNSKQINRIPLEVSSFSIIHLTIDKVYQCNVL